MRFDNLNDDRYCELFLIGGDAITEDLKADFYSSTQLNGGAINRDSCSQAVWDKVDTDSRPQPELQGSAKARQEAQAAEGLEAVWASYLIGAAFLPMTNKTS